MVSFTPFKALTPPPHRASEVAAPPYDVVDREEARAYIQGRPHSLMRVTRPDALLSDEISLYAPEAYARAVHELQRLIDEGLLVRAHHSGYYAYAQHMGAHSQIGLVGLASAKDYWEDRIKKHEFTLPHKEDDRMRQVETLKAHLGPIFLTYKRVDLIDQLIEEVCAHDPAVDFMAEDAIRHQVWPIDDPATIDALRAQFATLATLYIADGHHRAAAASRVGRTSPEGSQKSHFLSVAFPDHALKVLAYNRVVTHLNGHTPSTFKAEVERAFILTPLPIATAPEEAQRWTMCLDGQWYRLDMRAPLAEAVVARSVTARLDVSILQDEILRPILGVDDPRTADHIRFVGGIRGLSALEDGAERTGGVAFSLFPTSISELMSIADAGEVMPPKSTWFEPKLRSGLMISTFDED